MKEKKKIWLVQRAESTPHDSNGTRRLLRIGILAEILSRRGHDVVWWTSSFDHVSKTHRCKENKIIKTNTGYKIHYLETTGYKKNISFRRFIDNITLTRSFQKEISKTTRIPDVILASIPSVEMALVAARYAKEKNIPVLLDIRDLYPDVISDIVPKPLKPLVNIATITMKNKLKETCKLANGILGITEDFVHWGLLHAKRKRSDSDKVFRMAYSEYPKNKEKDYDFWSNKSLVLKKDFLQIIFIGTFTNSFDFDTIFEAAENIKKRKVQFTFCGNGIRSDYVKNKCKELDNCEFIGWINNAQIQAALSLADIGLAPYISSKNFLNNIPNKPAEYMSGGLVILTSLTSGPLSKLLERTGSGMVYNDKNKLIHNLEKLNKKDDVIKKMKKSSKETFQQYFNAKNVYGDFANFLESF